MQTLLIINNVPNSRVLSSLHFGSLRFTSFFRSFSSSRICLAPGGGSKPPFKEVPKNLPNKPSPIHPLKPGNNTSQSFPTSSSHTKPKPDNNDNPSLLYNKQLNPGFLKNPHANYHNLIPSTSKSNPTPSTPVSDKPTIDTSFANLTESEKKSEGFVKNYSQEFSKNYLKTYSNKLLQQEAFPTIFLPMDQLKQHAEGRELLKKDSNPKTIDIALEKGSSFELGKDNSGYKITKLGSSYFDYLNKTKKLVTVEFPQKIELDIVVHTKDQEEDTITFGMERHMSLICKDNQGNMHLIGYLTSDKSGSICLSPLQVKDFQNNPEAEKSEKSQQINIKKHLMLLNNNHFESIQNGKAYLSRLPPEIKEELEIRVKKMAEEPSEVFQGNHITRDTLGLMVYLHDIIASSKGELKHPLSEQQSQLSKEKKELDKKNKDVSEIKKSHE